jgi:hypothetical protein
LRLSIFLGSKVSNSHALQIFPTFWMAGILSLGRRYVAFVHLINRTAAMRCAAPHVRSACALSTKPNDLRWLTDVQSKSGKLKIQLAIRLRIGILPEVVHSSINACFLLLFLFHFLCVRFS